MSRAGKETLPKSVPRAISNYVISCFQLPVGICSKMKSLIANHRWGFEELKGRCKQKLSTGSTNFGATGRGVLRNYNCPFQQREAKKKKNAMIVFRMVLNE